MKFCDRRGTGPRVASGCKEGTEVGKKSNKTIQTWTIAFGVVLSLHTKVSKPATLSLGYRDKRSLASVFLRLVEILLFRLPVGNTCTYV